MHKAKYQRHEIINLETLMLFEVEVKKIVNAGCNNSHRNQKFDNWAWNADNIQHAQSQGDAMANGESSYQD